MNKPGKRMEGKPTKSEDSWAHRQHNSQPAPHIYATLPRSAQLQALWHTWMSCVPCTRQQTQQPACAASLQEEPADPVLPRLLWFSPRDLAALENKLPHSRHVLSCSFSARQPRRDSKACTAGHSTQEEHDVSLQLTGGNEAAGQLTPTITNFA